MVLSRPPLMVAWRVLASMNWLLPPAMVEPPESFPIPFTTPPLMVDQLELVPMVFAYPPPIVELSAPARMIFWSPPPMVVATSPASKVLFAEPPITLGVPLALGSSRSARWPLTFNSNGWLSRVPRNFPLVGLVPLLPAMFQKLLAASPPTEVALTFVSPVPLPMKLFAGLLNDTALL